MAIAAQSADVPMKINVDHAGICAYKLEPIQQAFAGLGLETVYGGAHATGGTHNALLGFDDGSYLELIALQHPENAGPNDTKNYAPLKPDRAMTCFWASGSENLPRQCPEVAAERHRHRKPAARRPQAAGRSASFLGNGWDRSKKMAAIFCRSSFRIVLRAVLVSSLPPSVKGSELRGIRMGRARRNGILKQSIAFVRKAYGWPAPILG